MSGLDAILEQFWAFLGAALRSQGPFVLSFSSFSAPSSTGCILGGRFCPLLMLLRGSFGVGAPNEGGLVPHMQLPTLGRSSAAAGGACRAAVSHVVQLGAVGRSFGAGGAVLEAVWSFFGAALSHFLPFRSSFVSFTGGGGVVLPCFLPVLLGQFPSFLQFVASEGQFGGRCPQMMPVLCSSVPFPALMSSLGGDFIQSDALCCS